MLSSIDSTIIRHDDWEGMAEFKGGESLVHQEIVNKYELIFKRESKNIFIYKEKKNEL